MKKIILISMIISALVLFNSCGSNKEEAEEKTDVEQTTTETNQVEPEENEINEEKATGQNCDEFLVEYEKFMQEYIAILKKYQENPSNSEFLAEYMEIAKESEDWDNKSADCENDPAFMAKFLEIQLKISEAAAGL